MNERILVVDDEKEIADLVELYLSNEGYRVAKFYDALPALEYALEEEPDLAVLDVMLPEMDGFTLCQRIRQRHLYPIIMLTARVEDMDKITGLTLGADDYVTKPFSPMELVARVDAVFRRVNMAAAVPEPTNELRSGPFLLNIRSRSLTKDGKKIDLTQVEFQLMEHFLRNPNMALDRSSLLTTVWGDSYFGDDKIVDVNMRRLRMKIEDEPSSPKYLTTVWGFGYKWVCPDTAEKDPDKK